MLNRIQSLPKWVKITSIVVGALILIILATTFVNSMTRSPLVGKWEPDYDKYGVIENEPTPHYTFNSDGTFTFGNDVGVYTTKDGVLTLDFDEPGVKTISSEYEIIDGKLAIAGKKALVKTDRFHKQLKSE
ncbi:MAG: hypothetical protein JJE18_01770 [Eubacteriaceae bacterium]|nr:hypothetical protein [Eubacteriaceae bacterium]